MADAITLSLTRTYTGPETVEIFTQPSLSGQDMLEMFRVMQVVSLKPINLRPKASKIARKTSTCAFSPNGTLAITDKNINVYGINVQVEECFKALENSVFGDQLLRLGSARPDLTGTVVQQWIETFIQEGVKRDNTRVLWWGLLSDSSNDWNWFDGFIQLMLAGSASFSSAMFDMSTVETGGALDADAAVTAFEFLVDNIDSSILEMFPDLRIYTTRGMVSNYKKSLRNAQATDFGSEMTINGIPRLAYDNIPIMMIPELDADMADAANPTVGSLNTTSNNLAILTVPDNLIIGTDLRASAEGTDAAVWYSMDNQSLRADLNYKLGCQTMFNNWFAAAW